MEIIRVPVEKLRPAEKNVRMHPETQIKEYARSLEKNGQLRPIVIDEEYNVWIGNGMLEAAKRLGWAEIEALVKRNLSEHDKMKLMVTDNKIFSLGTENLAVLDEFLAELAEEGDIPGFDDEFLQMMFMDEDDVDQQVNNFGILNPNELRAVQNAAERRAEQEQAPVQTTAQVVAQAPAQPAYTPPAPQPVEYQAAASTVAENATVPQQEQQKSGSYIVCPHCGEKIWL